MSNWKSIQYDADVLKYSFLFWAKKIKKFQILSKKLIPDGLKPHTRSISWLAEQVLVQTAKYSVLRKISKVVPASSDINLYDCKIILNGHPVLVNVKVTQGSDNKNDLNQAVRLYELFKKQPHSRLFYVILKIKFKNNFIYFLDESPTVIFAPWIADIYVNPKNGHLQANYYHSPKKRTTKEFVKILSRDPKVKKLLKENYQKTIVSKRSRKKKN